MSGRERKPFWGISFQDFVESETVTFRNVKNIDLAKFSKEETKNRIKGIYNL